MKRPINGNDLQKAFYIGAVFGILIGLTLGLLIGVVL